MLRGGRAGNHRQGDAFSLQPLGFFRRDRAVAASESFLNQIEALVQAITAVFEVFHFVTQRRERIVGMNDVPVAKCDGVHA